MKMKRKLTIVWRLVRVSAAAQITRFRTQAQTHNVPSFFFRSSGRMKTSGFFHRMPWLIGWPHRKRRKHSYFFTIFPSLRRSQHAHPDGKFINRDVFFWRARCPHSASDVLIEIHLTARKKRKRKNEIKTTKLTAELKIHFQFQVNFRYIVGGRKSEKWKRNQFFMQTADNRYGTVVVAYTSTQTYTESTSSSTYNVVPSSPVIFATENSARRTHCLHWISCTYLK